MVTHVYVKFVYNRLRIVKPLTTWTMWNFGKSDNKRKKKNKVRIAWGPFPGPNT